MAYEGLNFESFKVNLKEGKYEAAAGARRAVGRAQSFSEKQRNAAREMIDAHFGESSSTPKAAKPAKKAAAKKAAPAPKKAASSKAPAAAPAKRGRKPKAAAAPEPVVSAVSMTTLEDTGELSRLLMGERFIAAGTQAIETMGKANELLPGDSDITNTIRESRSLIHHGITILRELVGDKSPAKTESAPTEEAADEDADDAPQWNGAGPGQAAFQASAP